ncbi:MAG: MerR family transcriptional regulator [Acetobacteraceae bacterium]
MVDGRPVPDSQDDAFGAASAKRCGKKAPDAYRTISEVADLLHVPQHVLRFWETRFHEVAPLKSGGGRRYYSQDQIDLLRRISELLYVEGYTIKGVQRVLRGHGEAPMAEATFRTSDYASAVGFAEDSAAPFVYQPGSTQNFQDGINAAARSKTLEDSPRGHSGRAQIMPGSAPRMRNGAESKMTSDSGDTSPDRKADEAANGAQMDSARYTQLMDKQAQLIELLRDLRVELLALRKNLPLP